MQARHGGSSHGAVVSLHTPIGPSGVTQRSPMRWQAVASRGAGVADGSGQPASKSDPRRSARHMPTA